jgi:hypothetical protein
VTDEMYRERRPVAELGGLVACVSVQQVFPGSEPYTHRPVPNGSAELLCEVGAVPRVVGPQTGPVEYTLAPGAARVGVQFTPGAAPSVLGVPASELVDLSVGADDLWGRSAVAFGEGVAAAASPREAAAKLEAAVAGRLADAPEPDPIASFRTEIGLAPPGSGSLMSRRQVPVCRPCRLQEGRANGCSGQNTRTFCGPAE